MPIYEYRCKECHQIFEEWVRQHGDEEPRKCPICNGVSGRIMSNTSFVLNGEGWYVTDYGYKSQGKTGADAGGPGKADSTVPATATAAPPAPAVNSAAPAS